MILIEIIVILFILFIINPERSIDLLRKAGYYTGKFRKFFGEIKVYSNEFNLNNMEKEAKESNAGKKELRSPDSDKKNHPNNNSQSQMGEQLSITKLAFLDIIESSFSINMTKSIIPFLFDDSRRIVEKTISILKKDPLFMFEKRSIFQKNAELIIMNPNSSYFNEVFSPRRIDHISKQFIQIPEHRFKRFIKVFAEFRGIENLRIDEIFTKDKLHLYNEYKKHRKDFIDRWYPPKGYISLDHPFNFNCNSCTSKELNSKFSDDIKLEDFIMYIKRLKNEFNAEEICLIGDETNYFNKLPEFINELEKEELYFNLSTTGVTEGEQWRVIASHGALKMVTLHIETDEFYNSSTLDTILDNVKFTAEQHKNISFKFNMTKMQSNDWSFLNKYIDLVPEFIFSFKLPIPIYNNEYLFTDEIKSFGKVIIEMIHHIRDYCGSKKFRIVMAKPLPLCVFTEEEYKEIFEYVWFKNICDVDRNNNCNNILINPNGTFQPCSGLNSKRYVFKDFGSGKTLPSSYHMNISRITNKPMFPECKNCYLFSIGVCQGLCYTYSK